MSSGGHGGRRRGKKHEEEEHENHERWLVSYADMMTLLLVLFVVLFAMSQVDKEKFAALASGLSEAFGAPVSALSSAGTNSDASVLDSLDAAVDVQIPPAPAAESDVDAAAAQAAAEEAARVAAEARAEYDELAAARDAIDAALAAAGHAGAARFEIDERGLVVHIVSDPVLFGPEEATLQPAGRTILDAVAPTLAALPNRLAVEGHANSLPVTAGGPWPSNWELSAYRATTVVRYLAAEGVPQDRLSGTGYSDTRPVVPASDPNALSLNRRVDIVVLSDASAEAAELLPGLDAPAQTAPAAPAAQEGTHE
ncbi:flagellar motor protein MotB [Geodermatophilus aquaeductus]|uniref:Chemotaxis protein MotB n=1 Tax=Geodermatophilus aquaeductus TaxID=1564161 RepID=A0A521CJZ1_9ACTN|nr:flagellar motor protein MotB [Geodermatophilus aquaeductus]SMO59779.1 chemotaxis protein MotB [Geodermatophilus aquaeductus]